MGLNTVGLEDDRAELVKLARELEEAGYVRGSAGGYAFYKETKREPAQPENMKEARGYYALTDEGKRNIQEEENQG
jgi:DNA-binding PadR family transcriptional regulator